MGPVSWTPLCWARCGDDIKDALPATVPNPARLGDTAEFADLATSIVRNGYLNGETTRLDGAVRMTAS